MLLKFVFFVLCLGVWCQQPPPSLPTEFIATVNLTKQVPGHGIEQYEVRIYYDTSNKRIRMDMQNKLHHTKNLIFFKTVTCSNLFDFE